MFPSNEAETIALYKLCQHRLGWKIVHLQTAFPDAIIENEQGKRLIVEFEFKSRNFQSHKHNPADCDIIIAYKNDWENPPVPVWELRKDTKPELAVLKKILWSRIPASNLSTAYDRIHELEILLREKQEGILKLERLLKQREVELSNLESSVPISKLGPDLTIRRFKWFRRVQESFKALSPNESFFCKQIGVIALMGLFMFIMHLIS